MRTMTITITGCKHTPEWETLQDAVKQATGEKGRFTRIARPDNKCDYRAPAAYELTFTPVSGDDIAIKLDVQN